MLQVLWERGFIDPNLSKHERWKGYPVGGRKNNLGELIPGTGLREMVSSLPDFQNEVTLPEHHAVSRSTVDCKIQLICSPKCHPEIAGEGIEYDWAGAKSKKSPCTHGSKGKSEELQGSGAQVLEKLGFRL